MSINDNFQEAHDLIKLNHIEPFLQREIEKAYFEKTYWVAMLKKIGGEFFLF